MQTELQSAEKLGQDLPSETEDLLQRILDDQSVDSPAEDSIGQGVGYLVTHLDPSLDLDELVFMMPDPVWSYPLFIDKSVWLVDICNLSYPRNRDTGKRTNFIRNEEPGIDSRRQRRNNFEAKPRRGNPGKIGWIGEKGPCGGEINRKALGFGQSV
jgi:hypothetical protein